MGVIVADTWANRPQRTRAPTDIYQAGTEENVKKPGRGRGGDREDETTIDVLLLPYSTEIVVPNSPRDSKVLMSQ